MAQDVTLGGDRLGSGNKQKVELHNYQMNSFNLEQDFKSSMAPGILYPFIKMVGTNHGTFDIDLDSFVRTLPTKGPLFGSFKLQADLFCVPIRLYQGILHNNPIGIGLNMNQVYLPKINLRCLDGKTAPKAAGSNFYNRQINESSLLKYLGLSGIMTQQSWENEPDYVERKINAVPVLAYYDIFKCYYSNKQEENAYVIIPDAFNKYGIVYGVKMYISETGNDPWLQISGNTQSGESVTCYDKKWLRLKISGKELNKDNIALTLSASEGEDFDGTITELLSDNTYETYLNKDEKDEIDITIYYSNGWYSAEWTLEENTEQDTTASIKLQSFPLANIDEMRNKLLSNNSIGDEYVIANGTEGFPYDSLVQYTADGISWNAFQLNGLVVKTYQSDLFNNWLETSAIDMINQLTSVSTSGNSFTIDSLNFAEKYYEVLNRIQVSGGTYEDWQEAVYGEGAVRKAETPMYVGGMSAEVMFEEVISTAETEVREDFQALGSLGGKGTQVGKRGGNNIHIKCDEPCYIMGIVSLTPRICYSQGNDWDLTELDTLDDLHKPGMDGIGFQDLIVEQMAWWDTQLTEGNDIVRNSAGKQTAWINYQTAVDKCFGDFAKQDGYGFMVLNRNYEVDFNQDDIPVVKDVTTYIDPTKYNYAFAVTDLAAQNFWVQIHSKVIARRKMGAQQIPNL